MADALWPEESLLRTDYPVFIYRQPPLLIGEMTEFVFFEPRYRHMAREALDSDNRFLLHNLLPEPSEGTAAILQVDKEETSPDSTRPLTSFMYISDHQELPDGRYLVKCIVGPRCVVRGHTAEGPADSRLARATEFSLISDEIEPVSVASDSLRRKILSLLLALGSPGFLTRRAPPPVDNERFSFWALNILGLSPLEKARWVHSQQTEARLKFIETMLATKMPEA